MREIKAYIRPERADDVIHALHDAGITYVTVTHVRSMGRPGVGVDPKHRELSLESGTWYTDMVKLEVVCAESELDRLLHTVRTAGRTGQPGDGIVFVYAVDRVLRIRTGQEGREALR